MTSCLAAPLQNYQRDFDPAVGRYVESDPLGLKGGASTYAYVGNDPIDAVDPTGLIKYWPADSNSSIGRAICDGSNGMTIQPTFLTPAEKRCGIGDCVRRHELIHIIDLRQLDPKVCVGQLRNIIPGFDTTEQKYASETRAFAESLRCLREKQKQTCPDCFQIAQKWIDWLPESFDRAMKGP